MCVSLPRVPPTFGLAPTDRLTSPHLAPRLASPSIDERSVNNPVLAQLGMGRLKGVAGVLEIRLNPALPSLASLEALQSVAGGVDISENDSLENLSNLSNVEQIGTIMTSKDNKLALRGR